MYSQTQTAIPEKIDDQNNEKTNEDCIDDDDQCPQLFNFYIHIINKYAAVVTTTYLMADN
ncbi:hypothetical protein DERP_004978 [Dermatophagoides pteronyssinus]|uniref:Uncharacterized protein n=1 Tax=Dermatophagoides pteronyssinus TaxID=6956 RepID=A0ABQ8JTI6_DERPT|nr:hypothetical protein DERP_004978 [Dermatophagoides pteronyssinus]